jgi:hypothetical protein
MVLCPIISTLTSTEGRKNGGEERGNGENVEGTNVDPFRHLSTDNSDMAAGCHQK